MRRSICSKTAGDAKAPRLAAVSWSRSRTVSAAFRPERWHDPVRNAAQRHHGAGKKNGAAFGKRPRRAAIQAPWRWRKTPWHP